ncbi:hypothetical protein CDD83_545 [Cordyceps sp. RAO-2017]|nr:hypothetical protein CDD83_545 [Cordyceps sp. RAO-2017]
MSPAPPPAQKRHRIALSCEPCRTSKLKCDRLQPCGQCARKGHRDLCAYAPKPPARGPRRSRKKAPAPAKDLSERLQRLEGMVRTIMDSGAGADGPAAGAPVSAPARARVVRDEGRTRYVGATHCMAMLEDIEVLKSHFDDADGDLDGDDAPSADELEAPEMLLWPRGAPASDDELLAHLPPQHVADRLITRYFSSMSPSQHIIHRPTFTRAYGRFWQDASCASLHWVAQLFMVLALGVLFNSHSAPHELDDDGDSASAPPRERIRRYRRCAGWALVRGRYARPTAATLPAFLLYVEAHFLFSRASQMDCYLLSGVCVRLMLRMGLHRDPASVAGLSAFEGEMRRRMWNMAAQIESLVAFHVGLPSMLQGLETDTAVPRNLQDDDLDERAASLPPARPPTDYTHMTYPIHKARILRVFAQIARQAHALAPPGYGHVLELDRLLQETWAAVPALMRVRPLPECVGDAPGLIMQRFGLAAVYNKCRCVLHRRYLAERPPDRKHDYSRRQCLRAATTLLENQHTIWRACQPGNLLRQNSWFVSSLAVHDYLLAAVVVYLVIQNLDSYSAPDVWDRESSDRDAAPTREGLEAMIRRSHAVWSAVAAEQAELKKTADTLSTMLARLESPPYPRPGAQEATTGPPTASSGWEASMTRRSAASTPPTGASGSSRSGPLPDPEQGGEPAQSEILLLSAQQSGPAAAFPEPPAPSSGPFGRPTPSKFLPDTLALDDSWMLGDGMDWRHLDVALAHSHTAGATDEQAGLSWEISPFDEPDLLAPSPWDQ